MGRGRDDGSRADALTLLTTTGGILAVKTFRRGEGGRIEEEGYGRARTFTAREVDVDGEGEWLRALGPKQHSFVVLGRPIDWRPGERKRRLSSTRDGDAATIEDCPRSLMPVDVDRIGFDPLAAVDDGETLALEVMGWLGLRGRDCVWHLTNSHGMGNNKRRIRLWVRLARPATCEQMKAFARFRWKDGQVDPSVYRPAQPIYTGDPVFEVGEGPVRVRVGHIEGEPLDLGRIRPARRDRATAVDDPNVALLQERGYYIDQLRPGQHAIHCPWESEHTDSESRDDDTFYFEPHFNGHDRPAFKCHHAHCDGRTWEDALIEMGVPRRARGTEASFESRHSRKAVDGEDRKGSAEADVIGPCHAEPEAVDGEDGKDGDVGFVFIYRMRKFWDPRDGELIDRESFDAMNGGVVRGNTPTNRFLASKRTEKVDVAEFVPGEPRIAERGDGIRVLNTYVDLRVRPDPSVDVSYLREHVEWMIPDAEERRRVVQWMAWVYKRPERKVTWAPILYGSPGTGKTTLMNALVECVGRRHMSEPTQSEIEDRFTDWAFGKRIVKIEELMCESRYKVVEKLKPIVANPTISVRGMYSSGFSARNFCNVIASTNHMDALPIERGDRRYMLVTCRDASGKARMRRLWKGLRDGTVRGERAISTEALAGIAAWLESVDLCDFRPESEAPMTELKGLVSEATMTDFERAVDMCEAFDALDLITSTGVTQYLEDNECKIATKKLGLLAKRRGWKGGPQARVKFLGERRVTLWTATGDMRELKRVCEMDLSARRAYLERHDQKLRRPGAFSPKPTKPTRIG